MNQLITLILGAIVLIVAALTGGIIMALPVMLLWNTCIVGTIAGVGEISWLQALGILVLSALLFNSNTPKA